MPDLGGGIAEDPLRARVPQHDLARVDLGDDDSLADLLEQAPDPDARWPHLGVVPVCGPAQQRGARTAGTRSPGRPATVRRGLPPAVRLRSPPPVPLDASHPPPLSEIAHQWMAVHTTPHPQGCHAYNHGFAAEPAAGLPRTRRDSGSPTGDQWDGGWVFSPERRAARQAAGLCDRRPVPDGHQVAHVQDRCGVQDALLRDRRHRVCGLGTSAPPPVQPTS